MRSLIIRLFVLFGLFFPALAAAQVASYAGVYSGTYSGGASGTWVGTVSSTGVITGTVDNTYSASGQVSPNGLFSMTAGSVSGGTTFTGTINLATGICSGTWINNSYGISGTFTGVRTTDHALSIAKSGTGSGIVTSSPAGIYCGSTCSASFTSGTSVTLTATPSTSSYFFGWGGDCSGAGSCVVTMNAAKNVTATFKPVPFVATTSSVITPTSATITTTITFNATDVGKQGAVYVTGWVPVSGLSALGISTAQAGNILSNPGFESGNTGWTSYSSGGYQIIAPDATPHGGAYSADMCGYSSCNEYIYQDVTIPTNVSAVILQFWYYVYTQELSLYNSYDYMKVELVNRTTGSVLATLKTLSNLNPTTAWTQNPSIDLTAYAGQTIRLRFSATTDSTFPSHFWIDDVSLTTTISAAALSNTMSVTTTSDNPYLAGKVNSRQVTLGTLLAATDPNTWVLVQKTPYGWALVVNGQLIPYTSGVLGSFSASQSILSNTNPTNLPGAQFCVGYGTSDTEMITSGRMLPVAIIPVANSTSTTSGSCIVTDMVVEFYNANINHYFMTASIDEALFIDSKPSWGWARTGKTSNIWLTQASAPSGASPVCRFFGVFANGTVGSHFYTVDPDECAYVKGRLDWGWGYEGDAFYAVKPTGSACQSGTSPVYRVFNNGMGGAPNHRYMTNQTDVNAMVLQGWVSEGTAFCGRQ